MQPRTRGLRHLYDGIEDSGEWIQHVFHLLKRFRVVLHGGWLHCKGIRGSEPEVSWEGWGDGHGPPQVVGVM
jgi:hypothetical protein